MSSYDEVFQSICRVCLVFNNKSEMVSLIDNNDKNGISFYAKAVLSFANIIIEKQDGMPTLICLNCLYLLKQAINFKLRCESSDKCLKNIVTIAPTRKVFKEKLVEYSLFKLYLPTEPIIDSSIIQHPASDIKPKSKKLKNTEIINKTNLVQTNSFDKTSKCNPGADRLLDQLDLQFASKIKLTKQNKEAILEDNFVDNLNLPIESMNNTSKRKYSTSNFKPENIKLKNTEVVHIVDTKSFDNISTHNPEDDINISVDCLLDKLELQFGSPNKNINTTEQIRNILTHNKADTSNTAKNTKSESKDLVNTETNENNVERNSLDDTSMHDPDDGSNISIDCVLDTLESQFASTNKISKVTKTRQRMAKDNFIDNVSNLTSADCILDKLQSKFASKCPITLESAKPLKRKKLKMTKKYREKRKMLIERKRNIKNKLILVCNICDKMLANRHTYEQHMQRHNGCRYICEHCGKGFPVLYELQTHQVAQHGTGPHFKCSQCPFKAARKFDLIEHERLHSGERPFTCEKCGLTFRRRGIWRKHLIYHTEKSVQCPQCPRKFFQRSEMLAHANNIHDRVYVYLCSKCGATYAKSATVRRHMAERHGIAKEMQGKVIRINKGSSYNEQ